MLVIICWPGSSFKMVRLQCASVQFNVTFQWLYVRDLLSLEIEVVVCIVGFFSSFLKSYFFSYVLHHKLHLYRSTRHLFACTHLIQKQLCTSGLNSHSLFCDVVWCGYVPFRTNLISVSCHICSETALYVKRMVTY